MSSKIDFAEVCIAQNGKWNSERNGCEIDDDFFYDAKPDACFGNGDKIEAFKNTDIDACREVSIREFCKDEITGAYHDDILTDGDAIDINYIKYPPDEVLNEGLQYCFRDKRLPDKKVTQAMDELEDIMPHFSNLHYNLESVISNLYEYQVLNSDNIRKAVELNIKYLEEFMRIWDVNDYDVRVIKVGAENINRKLFKHQKFSKEDCDYIIKKEHDLKEFYEQQANILNRIQ